MKINTQQRVNLAASLFAVLVGSLTITPAAWADATGDLQIVIQGLRDRRGSLCVKLFSGRQGFPNNNDSAVKRACVAITETPLTVTFQDLTFGSYAVALYHDSNGDERLNRGAFGMPIEGYGFSNNPTVETGPPNYGNAVFMLAGPQTRITIDMRYPSR